MNFEKEGTHIMVDLETMSTEPNAAITQIGAVIFDQNELYDEFHTYIHLNSSMEKGGHVSASTILWWVGQSEEARLGFVDVKDHQDLQQALYDFRKFVDEGHRHQPKIWGNGAAFDNVVLRSAYASINTSSPWHFANDRCYRTFAAMHKHLGIKKPKPTIAHDALADAVAQAEHMVAILNYEVPK